MNHKETWCVSDPLPVASLQRLSPLVRGTFQQCPPCQEGQPWSEATGRGSLTHHVSLCCLTNPLL